MYIPPIILLDPEFAADYLQLFDNITLKESNILNEIIENSDTFGCDSGNQWDVIGYGLEGCGEDCQGDAYGAGNGWSNGLGEGCAGYRSWGRGCGYGEGIMKGY